MLGISIYTGMEYSLQENLEYLQMANIHGVKNLFTSLHIPEANNKVYAELKEILKMANQLGMQVIADVSKGFMDKVDLREFKIYALRLDFGFNIEEVVNLSRNYPFKLQINGSTISREYIQKLAEAGANLENMEVGHNYYPRKDTGISYDLLRERNQLFKEYGMRIMAFIPSKGGRRGPIYEGLPTIEAHRSLNPLVAAQHLYRAEVDLVVIGDAFAPEAEIQQLCELEKNVYTLPYRPFDIQPHEAEILSGLHTNRMDPGEFVIRSQEARGKKREVIRKNNTIDRKKYFITIDNEGYFRYEGELQILKSNLMPDDRVNVVGDATASALLIDMIKPGEAFRFIPEY